MIKLCYNTSIIMVQWIIQSYNANTEKTYVFCKS